MGKAGSRMGGALSVQVKLFFKLQEISRVNPVKHKNLTCNTLYFFVSCQALNRYYNSLCTF
jgi:hypothetical protein